MPLITDYNAVKDVYAQAAEAGISLPVFCTEDRETLEGILASALKMAEEIGVEDLPVIPAWTCRYPPRGQMTLITACGNPVLGTEMMLSDIKLFAGENSPYRKLCIMPHLDHAFPWLDSDILENFVYKFASVMYDASEKPFEENIRMTSEYVKKFKGQVVIEGAVDEIYESNSESKKNEPTTIKQAQKFLSQTGVDIIVPNVGTEHRATADQVKYRSDRAREISNAVGKILCLHGTSSVKPDDLPKLTSDGFIKINIYTTLAVNGGQAVAKDVINNLRNIFNEKQLTEFIQEGILGEKILDDNVAEMKHPIKPKLVSVANPRRRDAWFEAVRERCYYFLDIFNYKNFRG